MRSFVLALIAVWSIVGSVRAEYVIGPGDILQVTVWQNANLNQQVRVREDGFFTFPPIGDVEAVGLTTEELAAGLGEQLFTYTRGTTRVTITVVEFNSKYVIVSGAVAQPGRLAFQLIPSLPRVIGLAGGALPGARLSEVTIVRTVGDREEAIKIDLARALESGDLSALPPLQPGDVVTIPGSGLAADASAIPGVAQPGPGTIALLGAVNRPGTYPVSSSFALPEIIGLAGGLTPNADLRHIKVLSREPNGTEFVATLDLEEIFRAGEPVHYPIRPGDAIYIETRKPGVLGYIGGAALQTLSLSRRALDFYVLIDLLNNDENNTDGGGNNNSDTGN
jgi:polysaccharide export outer membrane protein